MHIPDIPGMFNYGNLQNINFLLVNLHFAWSLEPSQKDEYMYNDYNSVNNKKLMVDFILGFITSLCSLVKITWVTLPSVKQLYYNSIKLAQQ